MRIYLKLVVAVQFALIILLASVLWFNYHNSELSVKYTIQNKTYEGLLSPRVYAGLLESKSFLIVNYAPLREGLQSFIEKNNLNVSVYVVNMRDGASMSIKGGESYSPASLIKVPLAILILKRVEDRELSLDTEVEITDEDKSASYGNLYLTTQKKNTIRFLLEKMLIDSDDTAFLTLNRYKRSDDFVPILKNYLGFYNDEKHDITTRSVYNVFSSLYFSTILTPENSEYILSLLSKSTFDINYLSLLPKEVTVAHKFGMLYKDDERFFHDCGIMYIYDMRVFYCILTRDLSETRALDITGLMINNIYNYTITQRLGIDNYKKNSE